MLLHPKASLVLFSPASKYNAQVSFYDMFLPCRFEHALGIWEQGLEERKQRKRSTRYWLLRVVYLLPFPEIWPSRPRNLAITGTGKGSRHFTRQGSTSSPRLQTDQVPEEEIS